MNVSVRVIPEKSKSRKVNAYVNAVLTEEALRKSREAMFDRLIIFRSKLTGTQLGEANRLLGTHE